MGGPRHVLEDKIGISDHRIEYPEKRQTTMYETKNGAGSLKPGGRQTVLAGVLFCNNVEKLYRVRTGALLSNLRELLMRLTNLSSALTSAPTSAPTRR